MAKLMATMVVNKIIGKYFGCRPARNFIRGKSAYDAWRKCPDAEWLLTILEDLDDEISQRAHKAYLAAPDNPVEEAKAIRKAVPWSEFKQALKKKGCI